MFHGMAPSIAIGALDGHPPVLGFQYFHHPIARCCACNPTPQIKARSCPGGSERRIARRLRPVVSSGHGRQLDEEIVTQTGHHFQGHLERARCTAHSSCVPMGCPRQPDHGVVVGGRARVVTIRHLGAQPTSAAPKGGYHWSDTIVAQF